MYLPRTLFFAITAAVAAGLFPGDVSAEQTARPNVLFMLTDDQRWDAIGLGGSRYLQTPNMDRLGKEGVYFKNAFCTTSLCSPTPRMCAACGPKPGSTAAAHTATAAPTAISPNCTTSSSTRRNATI